MPSTSTSAGVPRTTRTPSRAVRRPWATWLPVRSGRVKPCSAIATATSTRDPDGHGARDEQRSRRSSSASGHRGHQPEQPADPADLGAPVVGPVHRVPVGLVGEPGVLGAAAERPAGAPHGHPDQHRRTPSGTAPTTASRPHHDAGDHQRQPAAVEVRDDAGGHLEHRVGDLQRRTGEHQLERAHPDVADQVDRCGHPAQRGDEAPQPGVGQPHRVGSQALHRPSMQAPAPAHNR